MAIFGDIERFLAGLYPYRWGITVLVLLLLTGAAGLGYSRGWHLTVRRRRARVTIVGIPALAVIVAAGWLLGSPLFTNTTVDEAFPFAARAVVPPDMTRTKVEQVMAEMAKLDLPVDEAMPPSMTSQVPETGPTPSTTSQAEAKVLSSGAFRDADSFHKGSGVAKIYWGQDGTHLLRLEDFKVTNGPELHVILSPEPDPESSEQVKSPGYIDLGKLKGNIGNQDYPIPEGVDVGALSSVVIYYKPFQVVFSVATLENAG